MDFKNLNIDIYADGANFESISHFNNKKFIKGFTTNPTLMKNDGVFDYEEHSKKIANLVFPKPVSFEVFSDDFDKMYEQAIKISSWNSNINVKIPITNTKGHSSKELIRNLSLKNVKLNITAIFTLNQVEDVFEVLDNSTFSIVSIFAGRIADTGIDPEIIINESVKIKELNKIKSKILWASPREVYNIFQAEKCRCDVITVAFNLLKKIDLIGKNLDEFSKETVQMFYDDAIAAGYKL